MIALLRVLSLLANFAVPFLLAFWLGAGGAWATACGVLFLAVSTWLCRRGPATPVASEECVAAARAAAQRMNAPAPRFVRTLPGWTAGVVPVWGGYGLYVGDEIESQHFERVFAHEIAHHVGGDLVWEGPTDGPGRLMLGWGRTVPPLVVIAVPFLLFGAPLARVTELRADRLATDAYPDYPALLGEVGDKMGGSSSVLYPTIDERIRSARRLR